MPDTKSNRRVQPTILARARELRRPMTPQEAKLWQRLRGKQFYGLKFRRQGGEGLYCLANRFLDSAQQG